MAVLPIRITGDAVLHAPAAPVTEFDDSLRELVADMFDTMAAAPGVGGAAPQVGVPLALFVFSWTDDDDTEWKGTAINPRLWITPPTPGEPDPENESEGCLSLPGERFPLRRAEGAILKATELDGSDYEMEAHGWLARIFQHEFDHLDGILYSDRLLPAPAKLAAKAVRKNGWGTPGNEWMPGVDDLEG
jgi:peptide deformylase